VKMPRSLILAAMVAAAILYAARDAAAQEAAPFEGEKTQWHGFDRYDFLMDEKTFAITPFKAAEDEGNGIKDQVEGKRRCIVVVPQQAAAGNPWSWRGCYWDHQPQTEVELLKRGFHVAFIMPDPGPQWDAWYTFLTEEHGLSKKPAFVGMSKGGVNAYQWATANPDKVSCIYGDNPALYPESFAKVGELAKNDVPLLHVCGSFDYLLEQHTLPVENLYHELGGRISVIIKEGYPHHPHSLQDPKPLADWIEQNSRPEGGVPPPLTGITFNKSYYYSFKNSYIDFPRDHTFATCRGPAFTECYDRYDAAPDNPWGLTGMTIIMPKTAAPGTPWVFRADRIPRDEPPAVDLALLAEGITIVAAPITTQAGPVQQQWDQTYKLLTDQGFSKKPALEGAGTGAGEAYAWAIANPDKVACIYAENPVMRSLMFPKVALLDQLGPLAQAGVPLLHVCGSLDPWLHDNSDVLETRYRQLGGQITVILKDGVGHYPLGPVDPQPVVDFIKRAILKT